MVGPKFMCFNNIDRSDFVHSGRLAFLRLALVAKFFLLKPKSLIYLFLKSFPFESFICEGVLIFA
jgi:hypothetical protein